LTVAHPDTPALPDATDPILIWGAGAIGGTLGAYWARAGIPVLPVDVVEAHVRACRSSGLSITGPVEAFKVVVPAVVATAAPPKEADRVKVVVPLVAMM